MAHFGGIRFAPGCMELYFLAGGLQLVYIALRAIWAGLCSVQFPVMHHATLPLTIYCIVALVTQLTAPAGTNQLYRWPFKKNDDDLDGIVSHKQAL